jgi:transketolase
MQALRPFTPTQIGGAADLVESTKTEFIGTGTFSATHVGRNVAFGIREHGMGSIVNGIAVEPAMLKPYGSTFLVFSDYMRPSVRLSALSRLPVMWIWTHDSVGLGEDGPTHQPVEHVMSLRAIPNLWVIRPGDANETVAAWRIALEREGGPVALALSRQKLPVLGGERLGSTTEGPLRGGYVLWQRDPSTAPEAIVLATGSEVPLALEAARSLEANIRVVSLPCWELFDEQDGTYREEVLPPSVRARVSIEAGITFGWERWVGEDGVRIGVDRFGASAPGPRVYEELGLTADAVADAVRRLV